MSRVEIPNSAIAYRKRKFSGVVQVLLVLALATAPLLAYASSGRALDTAPIQLHDMASLQRGAKVFVNYCLNCHSASYMRYNRLRDLGLSEAQIVDNLIFTKQKVGETMEVSMGKRDAKAWFGAAPPDLTVTARARGADWLYTYLRTFYRDDTAASGWNNLVFDKVAMPHVLQQLQGEQVLKIASHDDAHGKIQSVKTLELVRPGMMTTAAYDAYVADLVNYMVYMAEPAAPLRKKIGIVVLLYLFGLLLLAYALMKEFWKDVK